MEPDFPIAYHLINFICRLRLLLLYLLLQLLVSNVQSQAPHSALDAFHVLQKSGKHIISYTGLIIGILKRLL